jgi:hypothetical protein
MNRRSLIFEFEGMLFTGDATRETIAAYGNIAGQALKAIVFPHHGAGTDGSDQVVGWALSQPSRLMIGIVPTDGQYANNHPDAYVKSGIISGFPYNGGKFHWRFISDWAHVIRSKKFETYSTNKTIFELSTFPAHLVVLGGIDCIYNYRHQ